MRVNVVDVFRSRRHNWKCLKAKALRDARRRGKESFLDPATIDDGFIVYVEEVTPSELLVMRPPHE
jgi:hypothetical protein